MSCPKRSVRVGRKVFSWFLSVVLVLGMMPASQVLADEESALGDTPVVLEEVETPESVDVPSDVSDTTDVIDNEEVYLDEDDATLSDVPREAEAPEQDEAVPFDVDEEPDALSRVQHAKGMTVTASWDEGTLPEDVTMRVEEVSAVDMVLSGKAQAATKQAGLSGDGFSKSLDISFIDSEGTEIEPEGDVRVSVVFDEAIGQCASGGSFDVVDKKGHVIEHHGVPADYDPDWHLVHVSESDGFPTGAEDITSDSTTTLELQNNGVASLSFVSDSFSTFVVKNASDGNITPTSQDTTASDFWNIVSGSKATYDGATIMLTDNLVLEDNGGYHLIFGHNDTDDQTASLTIDLNGHTITRAEGNNDFFALKSNYTLTITDSSGTNTGTIDNVGTKQEPIVEHWGGTLNISNITIKNNTGKKPPICSERRGTASVLNLTNCTLSNNKTTEGNGGAIRAENTGVTIENCTITNNETAGWGGGIAVYGGTLQLKSGTISQNKSLGTEGVGSGWGNGGGGIRVDGGCQFTMSGGTVSDNFAQASGGGINVVGGNTLFTMTGGTINNNRSWLHEGGGLSVGGTARATMSGGKVTNNKSGFDSSNNANTEYQDWGGGGIFVSDSSTMNFTAQSVLIANNDAGGFGGGLAACATGRNFILGNVAIYDNDAAGEHISGAGSTKNEDHQYAYDNEVFMSNGYADYYSGLYSYLTNSMFNGGYENWTGSLDGQRFSANANQAQIIISSSVAGLTANPSQRSSSAEVEITGNESYTHGGGILNNGTVLFAESSVQSLSVGKSLAVSGLKALLDKDGKTDVSEDIFDGEFTFSIVDEDGNVVSDGVSKEPDGSQTGGLITFDRRLTFDENNCTAAHATGTDSWQFTYLITENDPAVEYATKDSTQYRLTVDVKRTPYSQDIGNAPITKYTYEIDKLVVESSKDGKTWSDVNYLHWKRDEAHADEVKLTVDPEVYDRVWSNSGDKRVKDKTTWEWDKDTFPTATQTATFTDQKIDVPYPITVTKVWDDDNNRDAIRPASIDVQLYMNGEAVEGKTLTLSAQNEWKATFEGLLKYDDNDKRISYEVKETAVPDGYTVSDTTYTADGKATITNAHAVATVEISGKKTWVGDTAANRPKSITVAAFNGTEMMGKPVTVEAGSDGLWSFTLTGLPKNDAGKPIAYTVKEVEVPSGYTSQPGTAANKYVVTNTKSTPAATRLASTGDAAATVTGFVVLGCAILFAGMVWRRRS